jgi:hypothetical protein
MPALPIPRGALRSGGCALSALAGAENAPCAALDEHRIAEFVRAMAVRDSTAFFSRDTAYQCQTRRFRHAHARINIRIPAGGDDEI